MLELWWKLSVITRTPRSCFRASADDNLSFLPKSVYRSFGFRQIAVEDLVEDCGMYILLLCKVLAHMSLLLNLSDLDSHIL